VSKRLLVAAICLWGLCGLLIAAARAAGSASSTGDLADGVRRDSRPGNRGWCWREICAGWTTGVEARRLVAEFSDGELSADRRRAAGDTISGITTVTGSALPRWGYFVGSVDMLSSYPQPLIDTAAVTVILLSTEQTGLRVGDVVRAFGAPHTTDSYCLVNMNGVVRCEIHICTEDNLCAAFRTQARRLSIRQPVESLLFFVKGTRPVLSEFYPPLRRLWRGFGKLPLGR
jgi:hypothetical protein